MLLVKEGVTVFMRKLEHVKWVKWAARETVMLAASDDVAQPAQSCFGCRSAGTGSPARKGQEPCHS